MFLVPDPGAPWRAPQRFFRFAARFFAARVFAALRSPLVRWARSARCVRTRRRCSAAISARAIFYSHEREQEIAGEFLGAQSGFFIDVGANDPNEGSQSWHLEQRGWAGVLVEPQPELADKLRRQPAAKVYGVACSSPANTGRTMTLYVQTEPMPKDFGDSNRRARPSRESAEESLDYTNNELGVTVANVTPKRAEELGYKDFTGVLVTDVDANKPAAEYAVGAAQLRKSADVLRVAGTQAG